ncbi:uncharacterized protein LOC115966929 [Quercus lobata]|uniref:uncharacterized protein LOC115966929 n=1 Tax=Quercus lobata TaxID=97700 RepID=UPI0012481A87|nr:uncharacterized protein LOC115966929 [Quercus lobata]
MQEYLSQVKRLQSSFDLFSLLHVSRSGNTHADSLATLATSSAGDLPRIILVEHLDRANEVAKGMAHIHEVIVGPSWMDPMVKFLKDDILPEEKLEAEKIRRKAPRFWLSEDHKLYKRSYSGPYLLCVHPEASELLLEELHEGICGSHTGGRVPRTLISDNGLQFDSKAFRRYCCKLGITNRYSTPAYPQGNRQAEAVNKVIVNGLKKRLDDAKGRWVEELPHILWTYRTTPRWSTGETPFAMTYGAKAVIPLEVNVSMLRTSSFTPDNNDELLGKNLDLINE